jgi:ribonuclease HII
VATLRLEKELFRGGYRFVAGVDEVGRGSLFGPVAAAILREAAGVGVGLASASEIDSLNILRATHLAMVRAVESLPNAPDMLLVDGFPIKDVKYRQMGIAQGDRKSRSIAAASIVAKVFRDGLMRVFAGLYEGYGLDRNKGYGTEEHIRSLKDKGPTGLHRTSFRLG